MSEPWLLKATVVPKSEFGTHGMDFEFFDFTVDVITPSHTFKNFKMIKNYAFGFINNGNELLIIDMNENPKLKLVRKSARICLN